MKEHFDIALIVPVESRLFPVIQMFLKVTRAHYSTQHLPEIHIYGSVSNGEIRILLRFRFRSFLPSMLQWLSGWIQVLNMGIIELESYDVYTRETILTKFQNTSDIAFTGEYDLDQAIEELKTKFARTHGVRKHHRFREKLKVYFRMERDFIGEYTDNISYGGMFIRGRTDISPRSRMEVQLELPGMTDRVNAIVEVIHVIPRDHLDAPQAERVTGFGVRFVSFLSGGEETFGRYLNTLPLFTGD